MAAYNPADPFSTGGSSPYDALRKKATQDAGNSEASGMDAIQRRFAATGGLNSGAYIQAQNDVHRGAQQQGQDELANIGVAEAGQALPYKQLEQQGSQFGQSLAEQKSEFGTESAQKNRALDLEAQQMGNDYQANLINQELGKYQQQHSGGLLGGGGFLGTGIGAGSGGGGLW